MKAEILDFISKNMDSIPLACMTAQGTPTLNMSKVWESLLTAAVTGGVLLFGYTQTVKVELVNIKDDIQEIKTDVSQIQSDIYVYLPKRR